MKQYYGVSFGHKQGPYSLDELASRELTPETMIWVVGIPEPTPAGEIEELRPFLKQQSEAAPQTSSVEPEAPQATEPHLQEPTSSQYGSPLLDMERDRKERGFFKKAIKYLYVANGVIALIPLIFLISLYPYSIASISTALVAPTLWGFKSYPQEFVTTIGQALYSRSSLEVLIYLAFIAILFYFLFLGIRGFQYWQKRKAELFATVDVGDQSKVLSVWSHFIESAGKWYAFCFVAFPVGYLAIGYIAFFFIGLAGGANVGAIFFTGVSFILLSALLPFIFAVFFVAFTQITARCLRLFERLAHDVSDMADIHRATVMSEPESAKEEREAEAEKDN